MDGVVDEVPDLRAAPASAMSQPFLVLLYMAHSLPVCCFKARPSEFRGSCGHSAITDTKLSDVRSDDEDEDDHDYVAVDTRLAKRRGRAVTPSSPKARCVFDNMLAFHLLC